MLRRKVLNVRNGSKAGVLCSSKLGRLAATEYHRREHHDGGVDEAGSEYTQMSTAAGAAGALIAVDAERKQREVIAYFEGQGALDPASAVALPPDAQLSQSIIAEMLSHGELFDAGAGTYWLDRDQAAKRQGQSKQRTNRALTIISAMAAAAAIAVLALR
jgi:hypothetical protein